MCPPMSPGGLGLTGGHMGPGVSKPSKIFDFLDFPSVLLDLIGFYWILLDFYSVLYDFSHKVTKTPEKSKRIQ